ncbi:MAG: ABC transporter permease [Aristaeellaceae bacterium]
MNKKQWMQSRWGRLGTFALIFLLVALVMYWVVARDWSMTAVETDSLNMSVLLPENAVVEQTFTAEMDCLERLSLTPHFNTAERSGSVRVYVYAGDTLLSEQSVSAADLTSDSPNTLTLRVPVTDAAGQTLTLRIDPQDTGMSLWAGSTMSAGKFDVTVQTGGLSVNGESAEGTLVYSCGGYNLLHGKQWFWPGALVLLAVCLALIAVTDRQLQAGKRTVLTMLVNVCQRYGFLLRQLVSRDFQVKYKASVLGVIWSFLNPLLTMLVYLFVFSTIFKSNVEHFPVYLMSGIVLFNYFSESTSLGLSSITGNSALITKVYMPKVIYPLSKVLSSAINLCISFIPLFIVMLINGVTFHKSILLLPLVVLFLLMFCLGMSLILSCMNVFFRDTQFLWSVLVTMWNFLTPIFYPESIIPARFQTLYHLNPLYQIVYFMRSITIGGVSPTPITYLYCTLASVIPLALGLWIFRKNQDKFVLHL